MKIKKFVIYAKKNFVLMKIIKRNLKQCKKSKITVITQVDTEERLIVSAIYATKYQKIPVVFHNGSKYDYHFIIKQLAREFKGNFEYLGENTEKYITFAVPIKKEHDNGKTTTYKLKFIDTCRFMNASLSSLVDNLSDINNKKPENKFVDTMKSMNDSLSSIVDNFSEINEKGTYKIY